MASWDAGAAPDSTSPTSLEQEFYRHYQQLTLVGPAEQETKLDLISKGLNHYRKSDGAVWWEGDSCGHVVLTGS